ncbi:hypothetical protein MXB_3241 [Myxobolus squamalis]|nr:hypothetical protein MXB_3241 [Myxobolus squamalis]
MHDCLSNFPENLKNLTEINHLCSKLSVLGGDFLFSRACRCLSLIEIPNIVDIMSQSITFLSLKHASNDSIAKSDLGMVDFINYINWRYVSLTMYAVKASNYLMFQTQLEDSGTNEFVKLLAECRALRAEIKFMKAHAHSRYQNDLHCKSKLISFYPLNFSTDLIISEAMSRHITSRQQLFNVFKDMPSSLFKTVDDFISIL